MFLTCWFRSLASLSRWREMLMANMAAALAMGEGGPTGGSLCWRASLCQFSNPLPSILQKGRRKKVLTY